MLPPRRWAAILLLAPLLASCDEEVPGRSTLDALRAEARAHAANGRTSEARQIYERIIEELDPDDAESRKALGFVDFHTDILDPPLEAGGDPIAEEIANRRGYPFLDAVVACHRRRWLRDDHEVALAADAVRAMRVHAERLVRDRLYRLGDMVRANISHDPILKDLNYETHWDPPYLICYSSSEMLSDFDLLGLPIGERKAKREQMAKRRETWKRTLAEKAAIFRGTYDEWMRRYAECWDLRSLTDEFGGRPDLRVGVRSFIDGIPLCIWIFTDHEAFLKFHEVKRGGRLPPGVAGYFAPTTGWIFLFDDGSTPDERVFEINKQVHEGVHQLEYWFTRQRNKWRRPVVGQNAISEGIAEYLGSVEMDADGKLEFLHVNSMRLENMQAFHRQLAQRGREYPVFPIENLISFETYKEAVEWVQSNWNFPAGMMLLYQQAWALTYFLNEHDDHRYQEKWLAYFDAVLDRRAGHGMAKSVFARIFELRDVDDWEQLNDEWRDFVLGDLTKR